MIYKHRGLVLLKYTAAFYVYLTRPVLYLDRNALMSSIRRIWIKQNTGNRGLVYAMFVLKLSHNYGHLAERVYVCVCTEHH